MTKFENSWGIYTGEGLARKQPKPIGRRVDGVEGGSGYKAGSERVTTHMEAATILKFSHYTPTCL